jgi:integrase
MGRKKEPYTIINPSVKGGAFYYRLGADPKRRRRSTGKTSRHEAVVFCENLLKESSDASMTFQDYCKNFYIEGKCPYAAMKLRAGKPIDQHSLHDERSRLENYLLPAFGDIRLKDLSVAHWDRWLESVESGKILTKGVNPHILADGTINRIRRTLIQILDIAVRYGVIQLNIARLTEGMSQKTYKQRDPLSDEDIKNLFPSDMKALLKIWRNIENIALYKLLLTSGLRSGEVVVLTWGKVSFSSKGLIVSEALKYGDTIGTPKNGTARVVTLPDDTLEALKIWKSKTAHSDDSNFLFYNMKGTEHTREDTILQRFKRILAREGIGSGKNLVIHSFRHTFVTTLSEKMPIPDVMNYTGHNSVKMIQRYTHPNYDNELKLASKKNRSKINSIWNAKLKTTDDNKEVKTPKNELKLVNEKKAKEITEKTEEAI